MILYFVILSIVSTVASMNSEAILPDVIGSALHVSSPYLSTLTEVSLTSCSSLSVEALILCVNTTISAAGRVVLRGLVDLKVKGRASLSYFNLTCCST